MIKEYDAFIDDVSDLNANGTATLNENIADNGKIGIDRELLQRFINALSRFPGGMKLSYRYFQSHLNSNGEQLTLPNFNFTFNQLFWILSAQVWCSVHDSGLLSARYRAGR